MITMGCDIGSLFTKIAIMDEDRLAGFRIVRTTGDIAAQMNGLMEETAQASGIDRRNIDYVVSAGRGASLVPGVLFTESEVKCAGAAAACFLPGTGLVIDIGGQSITSMLVNPEGEVTNLMRNDKCASGSGRFLEMMSRKLLIDIDALDETVARSRKIVSLSNQCAVFAESEVITHANEGEDPADILASICNSIANMVAAQSRRFASAQRFTLTGGVARFGSIAEAVQKKLGCEFVKFPFNPQLAAAIGAALLTVEAADEPV